MNAVQFCTATDTTYVICAYDGDFIVSDSGKTGLVWSVFPTGNHGSITEPSVDSTDSVGYRYVHTATRSYDGSEQITIRAGRFDAIRIREITNDVKTSPDGSTSARNGNSFYWIAPGLGFLAKEHRDLNFVTTSSSGVKDLRHSQTSSVLILVNMK
jgi:hypothetical protein